jgi:hypothetical protein
MQLKLVLKGYMPQVMLLIIFTVKQLPQPVLAVWLHLTLNVFSTPSSTLKRLMPYSLLVTDY